MLKPLLLLCWVTAITSADLNGAINGINIPANSENNQAYNGGLIHLEPTTESPASLSNEDIDVPSTAPEPNGDTKSTNNSTEMPKSVTPLATELTKPITTTKPTTPTTTTTSTTTSAPTTTPVPTTPAPTTPLPPPSTGKWIVKENNTYICIIVHMAAQFNINYTNANMTIHKAIDIPFNSTATGKCDETEQDLTLWWDSQGNSTLTSQNNFTLHFKKNETDKLSYSLHSLEISLLEEFPNDKLNKIVTLVHNTSQFNTGLSNSYRCLKQQSMNLTFDGKNEIVGHLKISNLQFQAFRTDNTTVFGLAKDCSFDTPDIVPITVGCALAGLVVIVLIAYLVGRRRSQARGYLSM